MEMYVRRSVDESAEEVPYDERKISYSSFKRQWTS